MANETKFQVGANDVFFDLEQWTAIQIDHWIATIGGYRVSLKLWPGATGWCLASVDHPELATGRTFRNPRHAALYAKDMLS